MIKGFAQ